MTESKKNGAALKSQLKKANKKIAALEARENHFQWYVDNAFDLVYRYIFKPEPHYAYISPSVEKIIGFSPSEFHDNPNLFEHFCHPDDLWIVNKIIEDPKNFEKVFEFRANTKDGSMIWLEQRIQLIVDDTGDVLGIEGIARDITRQKQIETQLRMERNLFVSGKTVVFEWRDEPGWPIDYASPNVESQFGFTSEHVMSKDFSWADYVHPDDLPRLASHIKKHHSSDTTSYDTEYRVKNALGNYHWVHDHTIIAKKQKSEKTINYSYVQDITDRKSAEESLERSEATNRALLDAMPDPMFRVNKDGTFIEYHCQDDSLLLVRPEVFLGKKISQIRPDELAKKTHEIMEKVLQTNQTQSFEYELEIPSLGLRDFEASMSRCGPNEVLIIERDITERKRAERIMQRSQKELERIVKDRTSQLQQSEETARSLINAITDIAVLFDNKGIVLALNDRFTHYRNIPATQMIGKPIEDLVISPYKKQARERFDQLLRNKKTVQYYDHFQVDGIDYYFDSTAYPVFDDSGNLVRVGLFSRDITKKKQDEADKKQLLEQLEHSRKMESLGTMAGGIAHDVNNILQTIFNNAYYCIDTLSPRSKIRPELEKIIQSGQKAKDLISSILLFSRDNGLKPIPVNPEKVLNDTLEMLAGQIPDNVQLKTVIDPKCGRVLANPAQFHQVVVNLCRNAIHAVEDTGGIVEIALSKKELTKDVSKPGCYISFKVTDDGQGMDKEVMDKIFDPFFTTKEVGKGTGLGLSVVHGIVEQYGGKVLVSSYPGNGASFEVLLPAETEASSLIIN